MDSKRCCQSTIRKLQWTRDDCGWEQLSSTIFNVSIWACSISTHWHTSINLNFSSRNNINGCEIGRWCFHYRLAILQINVFLLYVGHLLCWPSWPCTSLYYFYIMVVIYTCSNTSITSHFHGKYLCFILNSQAFILYAEVVVIEFEAHIISSQQSRQKIKCPMVMIIDWNRTAM